MNMKKIMIAVIIAVAMIALMSCNSATKNFGGTSTINLPAGRKLTNLTWKQDNLWILTRPMRDGDQVETWSFKEKSGLGILQGEVIVIEH